LLGLETVVRYVRLYGQTTLTAEAGFFLAEYRKTLGVLGLILQRLRTLRPRQPRYLDRRLGGKMAADWDLIVPTAILNREWGCSPMIGPHGSVVAGQLGGTPVFYNAAHVSC
jgi:hypothetical protein